MNHSIYVAASGAIANDRKFDIISNNLANVNTNGFKKSTISFASMLPLEDDTNPLTKNEKKSESFRKGEFNTFPFINKVKTDFSGGYIKVTDNNLDFAINGEGFFAIKDKNGSVKLTRDGNFTVNKDGYLVTRNGENVLDSTMNQIQIPLKDAKFINVDDSGNIYVNDNFIAKIGVKDIEDRKELEKVGYNSFKAKDGINLIDAKDYTVSQGSLEGSNVNVVKEMTAMIEVMRSFEASQKIITTVDSQLDQKAVSEIGRTV